MLLYTKAPRLTNEDDGVQCKHGQTECLGNIVLLCAAREYPDPKLHLGFANCLIDEYPEIPKRQLIEDCALEHGLDFGVLNDCMSKDTGAYVCMMAASGRTVKADTSLRIWSRTSRDCMMRHKDGLWGRLFASAFIIPSIDVRAYILLTSAIACHSLDL